MFKKILLVAVCLIFSITFWSTLYGQSSPTAIPIRDFKDVAGKWEGKLEGPTPGGAPMITWSTPMTIIINDDGTGDAFVPKDSLIFDLSDEGRFPLERTLDNGKIRSKNVVTGAMSTVTLHEEGGKRFIKSLSDDGKMTGIYWLAPK